MRLGQGGFEVVYKGVLPKENIEMALKNFSRDSTKCAEDDFLSELIIINKLCQKHLDKLVGKYTQFIYTTISKQLNYRVQID